MTIEEAQKHIVGLGVRKAFKPYLQGEPERERIFVKTRKPAQIVDGYLVGSDIFLDGRFFRVWTEQRKKAKAIAAEHGLRVRLLDGEAELWVPVELADDLLPGFGAAVKMKHPGPPAAARQRGLTAIKGKNVGLAKPAGMG